IIFVLNEIRTRKTAIKYDLKRASSPLFITKLVLFIMIINIFTFILSQYAGIPYILIILILLVLGYTFVMKNTVLGRRVDAVRGSMHAAQRSGIKTREVMYLAFVSMGILAAFGGIVFAGRLNAATPQAGDLFGLDAIAAAVIGGASFTGGVGTIFGAVIGELVVGGDNHGMALMDIGINRELVIKCFVLLHALYVYISNYKRLT